MTKTNVTEPHTAAADAIWPMFRSAGADTDWVSAHVFYQGDLTELLTNAVSPLVHQMTLDGLAAGWFFLRYWEGGPHLRLRVLPASGHAGDAIRALIADRLDRYLRERPSAGLMKHADYLRLAPIFAARERLSSYAERLYPNNSVVFLPYRREHHRYGHGSSIEAVERHFVESSRLAVSLLAPGRPPDQRDMIAFCLVLLTRLVGQPDPVPLAGSGTSLYHLGSGAARCRRRRRRVGHRRGRLRGPLPPAARQVGQPCAWRSEHRGSHPGGDAERGAGRVGEVDPAAA